MAEHQAREHADEQAREKKHRRRRKPIAISFPEYVIIIAVVALIVIGVLVLLGPSLAHLFARLYPHLFAT